MAGLIMILCIPIFCNGREPCNGTSIRKIESGSDKRVQQIRPFVNQVLNPFLASLYRRALRDAGHGVFPNNVFIWQFMIRV